MDRGENSFDHLYPTPPAPSRDQGHDMSRQQGAGGSNQGSGTDLQYPAVAAITNRAGSTPGQQGVPFGNGKEPPTTGTRRPQWTPRGSSLGTNTGGDAVPAAQRVLPGADSSRQERAAFSSRHKNCFSHAFQGTCSRQGCPFDHDASLILAGHFKAHANKKRSTDQREGLRDASHPKRRLYALSDDQVDIVAAYFDEDMESVGVESVDGLYA